MIILILLISFIAMIVVAYYFIDTIKKLVIKQREYCKIHGSYNPDSNEYKKSQIAIKILSFLYQTNIGSDPQTFNENLPFTDYYDDKIQLVIDKGQFNE